MEELVVSLTMVYGELLHFTIHQQPSDTFQTYISPKYVLPFYDGRTLRVACSAWRAIYACTDQTFVYLCAETRELGHPCPVSLEHGSLIRATHDAITALVAYAREHGYHFALVAGR